MDSFSPPRDWGSAGDLGYGTYLAFEGTVTEDGNTGTAVIGGDATDNGGLYHDLGGAPIWNLNGYTNLMLTARRSPDNQAANCYVVLSDVNNLHVAYIFPASSFPTGELASVSKALGEPDWIEESWFDYGHVASWDIHGGFTDDDLPFRMEFSELRAVGTPPTLLLLGCHVETNNLILTWDASTNAVYQLQSAASLQDTWTEETNTVLNGDTYVSVQPLSADGSKFFRLAAFPVAGAQSVGLYGTSGLTTMAYKAGSPLDASQSGSGAGPQPRDGIDPFPPNIYYTNWIDVISYTDNSINQRWIYWPGMVRDGMSTYNINYGSHSGGSDNFSGTIYTNHDYLDIYGWQYPRHDNSGNTFTWNTTWSPGSTNWPDGWRTETGYNDYMGEAQPPGPAPSAFFQWSKINLTTNWSYIAWNGMLGYTGYLSRVDDTKIELHTGYNISNYTYKFVCLEGNAWRVDQLSSDYSYGFEPEGGSVVTVGPVTQLSWSNITVLGEQLNADSRTFKQLKPHSVMACTPGISGAANYIYDVSVIDHKLVPLSRAYHPLFDVPPFTVPVPKIIDIQNHFNNGSIVFGRDDDTKIADDDPQASYSDDPASVYRSDDVPAYIEFQLQNSQFITNVLTRRLSPVFPSQFRSKKYFRIQSRTDADALLDWGDAYIKIVKSMAYDNKTPEGVARVGQGTILMLYSMNATVGPHEWCHTMGLHHRGTSTNPGPTDGAIMNPTNYPGLCKINRYERDTIAR